MNNKLTGSYYTPKNLSDIIIKTIFNDKRNIDQKEFNILEPSCGNGVFVNSYLEYFKNKIPYGHTINLVELNKSELRKATNIIKNITPKGEKKYYSHNLDFLQYYKNCKQKFDLIVGNPPYIDRKYLKEEQIELCKEINKNNGFLTNEVRNIWITFVISAVRLLKDTGILAFVLPGEILQVNYASTLRKFLQENFERIDIFTFKELIFENIEQDVVILFCNKKSEAKGLFYYRINDINNFDIQQNFTNRNDNIKYFDKWTDYILNENEVQKIQFYSKEWKAVSSYCESGVGIVTGINSYFIKKNQECIDYNISEYTVPIIQKSSLVPSCVNYTFNDYEKLLKKTTPSRLVSLNMAVDTSMNFNVKKFLEKGIELKIHQGFKCSHRTPWYTVPSVWSSEGIFFKRMHIYPKIISNKDKIFVTDTGYRIKMRDNKDINSMIFCFYNTLTLIYCELMGRYYGGGVLELTPNEFKEVPIPYYKINERSFLKLDSMFRTDTDINKILDYTDSLILKNKLGLSDITIKELRSIWKKLLNRRLRLS